MAEFFIVVIYISLSFQGQSNLSSCEKASTKGITGFYFSLNKYVKTYHLRLGYFANGKFVTSNPLDCYFSQYCVSTYFLPSTKMMWYPNEVLASPTMGLEVLLTARS